MKKILIVYGSKRGSTREIALRMKEYLREHGCETDLQDPGKESRDISGYNLIVIGSGIYGGMPHEDVTGFIQRNEQILRQKKTAVFAVCGRLASPKEKHQKAAEKNADKIAGDLLPEKKAVFAGRVPDFGWFINVVSKMIVGTSKGDYRDWNAIKDWTVSLCEGGGNNV